MRKSELSPALQARLEKEAELARACQVISESGAGRKMFELILELYVLRNYQDKANPNFDIEIGKGELAKLLYNFSKEKQNNE